MESRTWNRGTTTLAAIFVLALPALTRLAAAGAAPGDIAFVDAAAQAREYIGYYHSIPLTPEQEKTKEAALGTLRAPCCAKFSLASCCCPCNLAKSAWGLSHYLIARQNLTAEKVNMTVAEWLRFVNKDGFTGDACFSAGCARPFHDNGCGGMRETKIDS
jgi:hypothetical protein